MLEDAQYILDKVIGQITGYENPMSVEEFATKYAFDIKLPSLVVDATTGEDAWAQSTNPPKFITYENALKRCEFDEFMLPKVVINNVNDVLNSWQKINYAGASRSVDSENVVESDNVNGSQHVFRSSDVFDAKYILLCEGAYRSEYVVATQRAGECSYSARVEDSRFVSDSFSVSWSKDISKSAFIHDSYDLFECLFCSHLTGKKYCVANMQYSEEEYFPIKDMVMRWILGQ
jgi:hypothetical protein